jgi:hypothetical protein
LKFQPQHALQHALHARACCGMQRACLDIYMCDLDMLIDIYAHMWVGGLVGV